MKHNRGLRKLIISGMTRERLINLIKRKDSFYLGANFVAYTDDQLRDLANAVDEREWKKKNIKDICNN